MKKVLFVFALVVLMSCEKETVKIEEETETIEIQFLDKDNNIIDSKTVIVQ